MSNDLGPLGDGATVAVIGGGPAGAATAIALKRRARERARNVRVIVVEGKQFAGGQHYNQCVGVLSPPIATLVEQELGVPFPRHLTQRAVREYVLHAGNRSILLDGHVEPSLVVRRVQFDAYMLDAARQRGVEVVSARATDLEIGEHRVIVYTDSNAIEASVVVGAFGVDEGSGAFFRRTTGYRPPPTIGSIVTKCHPGESVMASLGDRIHAFLPRSLPIEFGALTPKGNHVALNIAGARVNAELMDAFRCLPEVRQALAGWDGATCLGEGDLRCFKGRFPCGLAHGFTGHRFLMVGDAAGLVRAFKGKGVTSAVQTGIRAAQVLLDAGIGDEALRAFHAANNDIVSDIPFGRVMRRVTVGASRLGLMGRVLLAAQRDTRLREALFDAVSAQRPYREVVRKLLSPSLPRALLAGLRGPRSSNG